MDYVVLGLGFGDEGKGLVTDFLCNNVSSPLVVRFSGGHQVGHTVKHLDKKHVFSNFGSGTLSGAPTYWSPICTVNPISVIVELNLLLGKNVNPLLYIDERCPVVTPYDISGNIKANNKTKHGSCGVGFGSTIAREESFYSLLVADLFFPSVVKIKLDLIKKYYNGANSIDVNLFLYSINELIKNRHIRVVDAMPSYGNIIYEGSQGILLDKNIGFFPHVTRSNTSSCNLPVDNDMNFYLVTRAYQTRHGNGPMTNENLPHNIKINEDETNVTNKYQGEFRRTLLDLDLLQYGISRDKNIKKTFNRTLVITCLDHIEDEYRFTHKGEIVNCNDEFDFVGKITDILDISNIITSHSPYTENLLKNK
jgi:adenylosuccinate synthase